jgi:hypothetical protein
LGVPVVLPDHGHVVRVACGVGGECAHLRVEAVELGLAALPQRSRVVIHDFALAQDPRVALLTQLPRAGGMREEALQVGDPSLKVRCRSLAGLPEAFAKHRVVNIPPHEVSHVADRGPGGIEAALHDERMGERRVQVGDARVHGRSRL